MIIAIDGPAGAGKSTIAKKLAAELGFKYLDSGAMYRALALKALEKGVNQEDEERLVNLLESCSIEFQPQAENPTPRLIVNGEDVSEKIRSPRVNNIVSQVSKHKKVREKLVAAQREMASKANLVAEGRDIGSVVFPKADLKIYLTASLVERARRRLTDLNNQGHRYSLDEVKKQLAARDKYDSRRQNSPLVCPSDAKKIDTTGKTIEEVTEEIRGLIKVAL